MAYMNVEKKNKLAPGIKKVLAEYGMKGTLAKDRFTLKVNLKSGPIDFGTDSVNEYHIEKHFDGVAKEFLLKLKDAMLVGRPPFRYHLQDGIGWYIKINIGKWDKAYEVTG